MPHGGFTFCGTHISSLGLSYAPDIAETYVYRPAEAQSHIETFDAHNGGYYYGSWYSPKNFVLRCFFEETNIDDGIMARIYAAFKVGKSGQLVFDLRPWCYYYATVTEPIQADFTNYLNGVITITLQAMYPFARSDIFTDTDSSYHDKIIANSAVFDKAGMELPLQYDLTSQQTVLLANPGTERAGLGIKISGDVGDGVTIANSATRQLCKVVALTKTETTSKNRYLLIDPISGKVTLKGADIEELAFMYHHEGFLDLEPSFPVLRGIHATYSIGNTVTIAEDLQDVIGKYIFLGNSWYKIVNQGDGYIVLNSNVPEQNLEEGQDEEEITEITTIMDMNEITIKPITDMDIHVEFIFKPTYA